MIHILQLKKKKEDPLIWVFLNIFTKKYIFFTVEGKKWLKNDVQNKDKIKLKNIK